MSALHIVYIVSCMLAGHAAIRYLSWVYKLGAMVKEFILVFLACLVATFAPGINTGFAFFYVMFLIVSIFTWISEAKFMNKRIGGKG